MKQLFRLPKRLTNYPGRYTIPGSISTSNGPNFTFPDTRPYQNAVSIKLNRESAYDDVTYEFKVKLTPTDAAVSSAVGIFLKCATDNAVSERAGFIFDHNGISFYNGDVLVETTAVPSQFRADVFAAADVTMNIRRKDDSYIFTIGSAAIGFQTVAKYIPGDATSGYYRQNVFAHVFGNDIVIEVMSTTYYTPTKSLKFALIGDSIAQGYLSQGGSSADTIKGILKAKYDVDIAEFSGSANIIKDTFDSFSELAIIKPKYGIIMLGHNDTYFGTGRTITDYNKLVARLKQHGIIPIICTMPVSQWIDVETSFNQYLRKTYFPRELHIDLYPVLTYPTDFRDGVHPNYNLGNPKLADAVYAGIKRLQ